MESEFSWRLRAWLVILLYVLVVGLVVVLIARNLGLALVLGPTIAIAGYGVWQVLTGHGARRRRGLIWLSVGAIVLIADAVVFFRDVRNIRLLAVLLGLSVGYVVLMANLRKEYWARRRRQGQELSYGPHFRKPFLIINPKSGDGRAVKAHVDTVAAEQGIHVLMLQKGDDVEAVARTAVEGGADVLGISGGDGSVGAVAKVALEHKLPVVVLPGGTRCHFARDLGFKPEHILDALDSFQGVERLVDAGSINGRIFLNNVSFGMYADIVDHEEYRNNKMAVTRQVLSSLASGQTRPYDLQFHRGDTAFNEAVQVIVSVNRYETTSLLDIGQRPRMDEGVLQVTAIPKLDDAIIRRLLTALSARELKINRRIPDLEQWTTGLFSIQNHTGKIVVGVDGEREEYTTPVDVRILPHALRIYVPVGSMQTRPKKAFSLMVAKEAWRVAAHGT